MVVGDPKASVETSSAHDFAPPLDTLERLWTPHRMVYIGGENKPKTTAVDSCPFCRVVPNQTLDAERSENADAGRAARANAHSPEAKDVVAGSAATDDAAQLVVARGEHCYVNLNLYPYNPGHLMVLPYRHVSSYVDLTADETAELSSLTKQAIRVLMATKNPAGFNLGMNQGEVAGAGIAAHLHQHVVPRWLGDANFLPIVGQTKAVPELLADTRARLAAAWKDEGC